jgi:ABC-type Fe3+ transport system permease subunit
MRNLRKKFRKLRKEYKIALISALLAVVLSVFVLLFVQFPVYGLLGLQDENSSVRLDGVEKFANTVTIVVIGLAFVSIATCLLGVYRDVRKKPKK